MKKNNIVIMVSLVVIILIIILIVLFIILPLRLNGSAKIEIEELINTENKVVNFNNENDKEKENVFNDSLQSQLVDEQKELFNQKFVVYETKDNENASFANVSTMFSVVSSNNDINENRKVDINGIVVNSDNIDSTKSCLDKNLKFKINCIYDNEGYVKTIELRYAQTVEEN